MPKIRHVKVLHAPDGKHLFDGIRDAFAGTTSIEVDNAPHSLPGAYERGVVVFVVTDQARADDTLIQAMAGADEREWPIVPLVENRDTFDFALLPPALAPLAKRNVMGWDQGIPPGKAVCDTIRCYLGMDPFKRDRKFFISYRRSDGEKVALYIYRHLKDQGYQPFLDSQDIEGGENVQSRISQEISERDFILLIDSPAAAESEWVRHEIESAVEQRITVYSLRLADSPCCAMADTLPYMFWDLTDSKRIIKLERFIASGIAAKESFDLLAARVLRKEAGRLGATCHALPSPRQIRFTDIPGTTKDCLFEFEDAPVTLEKLFRLYNAFNKDRSQLSRAFFLHSGTPLSGVRKDAVNWARGADPLFVMTLEELVEGGLNHDCR